MIRFRGDRTLTSLFFAGLAVLTVNIGLNSPASAQDPQQISFRNNMSADITFLIKSVQRAQPTQIVLHRGETKTIDLVSDGPFDIQVIPADEPNSSYFFSKLDLRAVAAQTNRPIVLKGEFRNYRRPGTNYFYKQRVEVDMEAVSWQGEVGRVKASRRNN